MEYTWQLLELPRFIPELGHIAFPSGVDRVFHLRLYEESPVALVRKRFVAFLTMNTDADGALMDGLSGVNLDTDVPLKKFLEELAHAPVPGDFQSLVATLLLEEGYVEAARGDYERMVIYSFFKDPIQRAQFQAELAEKTEEDDLDLSAHRTLLLQEARTSMDRQSE